MQDLTIKTYKELTEFLDKLPEGTAIVDQEQMEVATGHFDHAMFIFPDGQEQFVTYEGAPYPGEWDVE